MTDGQIGSASVGAVAMAPSDPDIVYIGMGEVQLRANVLQGDGVYRSDDAGKSWRHLGLADTHAVGRIRIHPADPDRAYVAALGHPFGPNPERGVFRTTDGGDTWSEITRNPGLPGGVLGKITVTLSGADQNRVWANVEAEQGGLYRSDDGGGTWEFVNGHHDIWQRAFYFQRLEADPVDRNTLYILNFRLMRSTDGGRTLESVPETHADHHDLWIDPTNPLRMINGNDGGGVVTVNGGLTWTSMRYPTAQIYRMAATADFPYHVCGAQQDNTTVCVSSERGHLRNPRSPGTEWMYAVGGGESGYIAPHPADPDIFYAGATNTLTRYDRATGMANPAVGPWAPPGRYRARLTVGGTTREAAFDVQPDPRLGDVPATAFADQFRLAVAIRDAESEANATVMTARDLVAQAHAIVADIDDEALRDGVSAFAMGIEAVAGELYQLRNQSPKDKIAFPIKLNDRLTGLRSHLERGDGTPTGAYQAVFDELSAELEMHLRAFERMLGDDLLRLNRRLESAGLPQLLVRPVHD